MFCDNEVSVVVLSTGRSRDPFLQACLHEICFLSASFKVEIKVVHLPGVDNCIPDLLSRWDKSDTYRDKCNQLITDLITSEDVR